MGVRDELQSVRGRLSLWRCRSVGPGCQVLGKVWVHGGGDVRLGRGVILDGRAAPIELHAHPGGLLILGDEVRVMGGASLESTESVVIGARSVVGAFVKVIDNDFHGVSGERHERPPPKPVVVESDVVLGERVILLPGAFIGSGSRLESSTVVSKRIAPKSWVKGNPPRVMKEPPP